MGIQILGGSTGFDPSQYFPHTKTFAQGGLTNTSYVVLDSITGSGFIRSAKIASYNGVSGILRLTIDGVVYTFTTGGSLVDPAGIFVCDEIQATENSTTSHFCYKYPSVNFSISPTYFDTTLNIIDLPPNGGSITGVCFVRDPIYFNQSFKAEYALSSAISTSLTIGIVGGVKK